MQALDGPDVPKVTFTNKIPDAAVAIGLGANANPIVAAPPSPEAFPKDISSYIDQFIEDKLGRKSTPLVFDNLLPLQSTDILDIPCGPGWLLSPWFFACRDAWTPC